MQKMKDSGKDVEIILHVNNQSAYRFYEESLRDGTQPPVIWNDVTFSHDWVIKVGNSAGKHQ